MKKFKDLLDEIRSLSEDQRLEFFDLISKKSKKVIIQADPTFSKYFPMSKEFLDALMDQDIPKIKEILKTESINTRLYHDKHPEKGWTPLSIVAELDEAQNNPIFVKFLLDSGADPNALCHSGLRPLHGAVICWSKNKKKGYDNPVIVNLLLEYGADSEAVTTLGKKPFDYLK